MQVIAEENKVNSILAQFQFALGNSMLDIKRDIKRACERVKDPNCQVLATKYLQLHNEKLIGNTALYLAASKNNSDAFDILLNLGADYTAKNHKNLTVLHQIIETRASFISKAYDLNDTFVDLILSAHLKNCNFKNPLNDNGLSHFHIACAFNHVEFVRAFLQNGIFVNHSVKESCNLFPRFTPLHFAARFLAFEVLKVLLTQGADIHIKNAEGLTPVHLALKQKLKIMSDSNLNETLRVKNEVILELLTVKENNNDMIFTDELGLSQLHIACALKNIKVARSLFGKVVNVDDVVNVNSPLGPGYTALHFAALCNLDAVKLLMKKGADSNIKDNKGVTPFDICIEKYKAEDIYKILSLHPVWKKIMLSDGKTRLTDLVFSMRNLRQFNVILKKFSKNFSICDSSLWPGYTPMHLAVLFAKELTSTGGNDEEINVQILRSLCEKNPSMLQSQDVHGYTPLHLAFRLNKNFLLNVLIGYFLESYPNLTNHLDEDGLSFLHIAAAKNNISLLKQMLFIGCDVNAVFQGKSLISRTICPGSTALHFAVVNGSSSAAETLMNRGADVYAKDGNDMTPIHLLLSNPETNGLLDAPNLKDLVVDGIGLSHLHIACLCNKSKIVKRLLDNGANINGIIIHKPLVTEKPDESSFLKKYTGYSPLLIAYKKYNNENVQLLLQRGADIFVEDTEGTALLYSILNEKKYFYLNEFVEALKQNDDMQTRLKADTGMTEFHVACFVNDDKTIEKLISEGADVNKRVCLESPIFQGYTPLHISLFMSKVDDVEKVIELLVKKGAEVTLPNAASQTVIHMAHKMFDDSSEIYSYMNVMLEAQRDYSLNPMNESGLTHFHIACNIFNTRIVEKFLEYADIDINHPIDYFHDDEPGFTALHLAAANLCEIGIFSEQVDTIDLLLKHGADVNFEDVFGDTPLFNCLRINYDDSNSLDVFERIARAGADVNAQNLDGHTPLYYYLETDNPTSEGLKTLLRMGCHLNTFDNVANHGYINKIIESMQDEELPKLFSILTTTFRQEIATDHLGRTAIHNIVSGDQPGVSTKAYASYIEQLSKIGVTVDDQDDSGRTALHLAANFYNSEGIAGLLMAGVDINVSDVNGKTAFAYDIGTCTICRTDDESTDELIDIECRHLKTLKTLAMYVKKLQLCGLDVAKQNEDFASKALEKFKNQNLLNENILKEIENVKNITIGSQSLTLDEFLSENGAVADYPRMSLIKRDAVNKFFSPNEVCSLREKFPELAGVLQLQYRKARARPKLVELAENALEVLVGFRLPEICSNGIFVSMKNSELMNLVESTIITGNAK